VSRRRSTPDEPTKAPLRAYLKQKGLHESKVRDLIVDTFLATRDHISLETLLEKVRKRNPSIGFATVYRTMKLLVEAGLAHERDFGARASLYEVAQDREHHDHLVCDGCGTVVEFMNAQIEDQQEKVARKHGFTLRRHRHELFGLCQRCQSAR
jgi:Fur family transcriptional regulator, ferric uptake regulator